MLPPPSTRPPKNLLPPTPCDLGHAFPGFCRRFGRRTLLMDRCGSLNGTFMTPSTGASCSRGTFLPLTMLFPHFQQTYPPSCELIWFCQWVGLTPQICSVRHRRHLRTSLMATLSTPLQPSRSTLPQQAPTTWIHPRPLLLPGSSIWMFIWTILIALPRETWCNNSVHTNSPYSL